MAKLVGSCIETLPTYSNKITLDMDARDRLIFPLDFSKIEEARRYIDLLKDYVGLFKVGLSLFVAQGAQVLQTLQAITEGANAKLFLDLKIHDIPETMAATHRNAAIYGAQFVTVPCDQGRRLLKAVVDEFSDGIKVLGITVLTSLSTQDLIDVGIHPILAEDITQLVLKRAEMAKKAGCNGVVCSGLEASAVKAKFRQDFIVVTPGIRPEWGLVEKDDQKRIVTPRQAIINGADYIVVGRPIRTASDPREAARKVIEEIEHALKDLEELRP